MTVRPTPSGEISRPNIGRAARAKPASGSARPAESATPAASGPSRDELKLSAEARALMQRGTVEGRVGGELDPARLRQVLQRVADGHYDRPEVRDTVLHRVAVDLR
jgi:hypothetical protein